MEQVNLKKFKFEQKKREIKQKVSSGFNTTVNWVAENKETIAILAPAAIGATKLFKSMHKDKRVKQEQDLKDLYIYDRSLGKYWKLRRKLTVAESLEIEARKADGEKLGNILSSMRVLG